MQPVNVALVGYGLGGRVFHAPLIAGVEGLRLKAVVSSRKAAIAKEHPEVAVLATADEAIRDPAIGLIVVTTPNDSHFDIAAKALAGGKHVVVDKPMTCTSAEARELIARARQAGRLLTVYHNRRWDSDFLTLKRLIAEGALGEIVAFESHFDRYRPQVGGGWRERAGPATGTWYDLGSHLIDQMLQLFGRPRAVTAELANQREGAVTTDAFRATFDYEGLQAVLVGSSLAVSHDLRFIVRGTRASFVKHGLDPQEEFLRAGGRPQDCGPDPRPGRLVLPDGTEQAVPPARGDYRRYYEGLRDTLAGWRPVPVIADEGLAVLELLEAGEASSTGRSTIALGS